MSQTNESTTVSKTFHFSKQGLVPCRRQWHQFSSCAAGPCLTHCGRGHGGFLASGTHGGAVLLLFTIDSTGAFAASRRAARAVRGNLWEPSYHNCALLCGFSRSALAGCCNQQGSRRSLSTSWLVKKILQNFSRFSIILNLTYIHKALNIN